MKKLMHLAAILLVTYFCGSIAAADTVINDMTITAGPAYGLPKTGQQLCYNVTGDTITCGSLFIGQDAEYANPAGPDIGFTRGNGSWANWNAAGGRFTDNADGTITDNATRLEWVQSGYADTVTAPPTDYVPDGSWRKYTWENALLYCERLDFGGHTDWRLPNAKELQSIADYSKYNPAIDTTFFTNTKSYLYWSSTTYADTTTSAWVVSFYNGYVGNDAKADTLYVRPVRGGQ